MADAPSLLPPNATALERRAAHALGDAERINVLLRALWQPQECPAHLLPWLAWALSVDEWDDQWSEAQKRAAVDAAVYLHRHKGTPAAVQRAVDLVFDDADVEEWFAYGGEPFHFRVTSQGAFASEASYQRLIRLIESSKNARSWLDAIIIRSCIELPLYYGAATAQSTRLHMGPRPVSPGSEPQRLAVGHARHAANHLRIFPSSLRISAATAYTTAATAYHDYRHITLRGL